MSEWPDTRSMTLNARPPMRRSPPGNTTRGAGYPVPATAFWNTASFLACPTPPASANTRTTSGPDRADGARVSRKA